MELLRCPYGQTAGDVYPWNRAFFEITDQVLLIPVRACDKIIEVHGHFAAGETKGMLYTHTSAFNSFYAHRWCLNLAGCSRKS